MAFGMKDGAVSCPGVKTRTGRMRVGRAAEALSGAGGGAAAGITGGARNVRFNFWESSPVVKYSGKIKSTARIAKWRPIDATQSKAPRRWCVEVFSSMASANSSCSGSALGGGKMKWAPAFAAGSFVLCRWCEKVFSSMASANTSCSGTILGGGKMICTFFFAAGSASLASRIFWLCTESPPAHRVPRICTASRLARLS